MKRKNGIFLEARGGKLKCLDQAKDPRTTMTPTTTEVIPRSLVFIMSKLDYILMRSYS